MTGAQRSENASIASLHSLSPYIMRAVMLLLVGLITTLVILRSRRLLIRAVDETIRRMIFPASCRLRLRPWSKVTV